MYEKKMLEGLKQLAKKSKTVLAKKTSTSEERCYSVGVAMAREVFREAIDSYEAGEMTWAEMVDDLSKTLKAIDESMLMKKMTEEKDED
jgi:hypothetical protein